MTNGRSALLLSIATVMACSGDPSGVVVQDPIGVWSYDVYDAWGHGVYCTVAGVEVTLIAQGDGYAGTHRNGVVLCLGQAGTIFEDLGSGNIQDGTLEGARVQFTLGDGVLVNTGVIDGDRMEGTVVYTTDAGDGVTPFVMQGRFEARRQ